MVIPGARQMVGPWDSLVVRVAMADQFNPQLLKRLKRPLTSIIADGYLRQKSPAR